MKPDHWPRITELQTSLPILDRAPTPFDPDALYEWARKASSRQRQMVRFVLDVFNTGYIRDQPDGDAFGSFNLVDSCAGLDSVHRQVIARWVADPWWC